MGEMEEREDCKQEKVSEPGAARHGNFINYYEFHPPEERLKLLPEGFGSRVAPEDGAVLVLDVGCNAGVSFSSTLFSFRKRLVNLLICHCWLQLNMGML